MRIGNLITCLIARWYSLLPKFVCGTIKPILKCCGDVSSFFEWWSVSLCRSPLTRFGPRSPMVMPDEPDDDCDRHAKVVAIIDTKANKMYDVFIITPSPDKHCVDTRQSCNLFFTFSFVLRNNCWNLPENIHTRLVEIFPLFSKTFYNSEQKPFPFISFALFFFLFTSIVVCKCVCCSIIAKIYSNSLLFNS